jgi:hypothetical protein
LEDYLLLIANHSPSPIAVANIGMHTKVLDVGIMSKTADKDDSDGNRDCCSNSVEKRQQV